MSRLSFSRRSGRAACAGLLFGFAALSSGPSAAQTRPDPTQKAAALAEAMTALALKIGMVRSAIDVCDERDPSRAAARRAAFESWAAENQLARYEALVASMGAQDSLAQIQPHLREIVEKAIEQADEICRQPEIFLKSGQTDLRADMAQLLKSAEDLAPAPEEKAPAAPLPSAPSGLQRLSQFSAEALRIMSQVALAREDMDSETRDAREAHLMERLEASGGRVTLYGRVTERDEMREWTEESQSVFEVECRNFADRRQKDLMAASLGRNMAVSGEADRVFDAESGVRAVLYLNDCALAAAEAPGEAPAEGLTRRPPSEQEAYAGPGLGIAMKDVDRVVYEASFDIALDGFGNLYTDREEAIYVLLKDGSFYAQDWSFPFTDLNLELSKCREPEKWGRWSERRGVLRLQAAGEETELEEAQRLVSLKPGTRLDHEYYYLNVGMAGARRDAGLRLQNDGQIERSRGGFVAGHVAGGFLAVVGPDQPILKGRYRFEDFALVIEGEDGREERIFFGVPEDEDLADPENVIFGGEVYWTQDEED